jgi:hypothetical protein
MRSPQAEKLPRFTTLEPSFFARLRETISKELASDIFRKSETVRGKNQKNQKQ